jgi:hypothetical protein
MTNLGPFNLHIIICRRDVRGTQLDIFVTLAKPLYNTSTTFCSKSGIFFKLKLKVPPLLLRVCFRRLIRR